MVDGLSKDVGVGVGCDEGKTERRLSQSFITKDDFLVVNVDLHLPLQALWALESARDFIKSRLQIAANEAEANRQKELQEIDKKIAQVETKKFITEKC